MSRFGFVANTLVHTPVGLVRIQEILPGDQVLCDTYGGDWGIKAEGAK
jgi:hypothetical protein